jgi:hypothetical protein
MAYIMFFEREEVTKCVASASKGEIMATAKEGRLGDAYGSDWRRRTRTAAKTAGRSTHPLIRWSPNGATRYGEAISPPYGGANEGN